MRKVDFLLVAGVTLSPMNGLRIGKVGPAEILLLVWCVVALLGARNRLRVGPVGPAWIGFFSLLLASTLHGMIVTPDATMPVDLATWGFLGATCVIVYAVVRGRTEVQAGRLLSAVGSVSALWFAALYVYGTVLSPTFLGAPLWYSSTMRFSGGADNPHQLAVLMAACVFINLRSCYLAPGVGQRLWHLALTVISVLLGYETSTSTLTLAIAATGAVTLFYLLLDRVPSRSGRAAVTVLVAMTVVGVIVLQGQRVITLAERFIDNDPNGWGRLTLWGSFNDILDHVLLLGLGPGTHASQGQMEFHNSYLELAAMLGLPGAALALVVMIMGLRKLARQWTLLTIVLPLFVYALPGFAFRRPAFWVIFALCLALSAILNDHVDGSADGSGSGTPNRSGLGRRARAAARAARS